MAGIVKVAKLPAGRFAVQLVPDPAVPGVKALRKLKDLNRALGEATGLAIAFQRPLVDETGHLTREQCDELVGKVTMAGLNYALGRLAKGLPLHED